MKRCQEAYSSHSLTFKRNCCGYCPTIITVDIDPLSHFVGSVHAVEKRLQARKSQTFAVLLTISVSQYVYDAGNVVGQCSCGVER